MPCFSHPMGVCIHPQAPTSVEHSRRAVSPLPLPNKSDCRKRIWDWFPCSCHKTDGYQTKLRHNLFCSLCVHPPIWWWLSAYQSPSAAGKGRLRLKVWAAFLVKTFCAYSLLTLLCSCLRQDVFCVLFWFLKTQKIDVSFASSSVPQSNVLLRREALIFFPLLMKQVRIWLTSSIRPIVIERKRIKKYKRMLLEENECPDMSPASLFCKHASQISVL